MRFLTFFASIATLSSFTMAEGEYGDGIGQQSGVYDQQQSNYGQQAVYDQQQSNYGQQAVYGGMQASGMQAYGGMQGGGMQAYGGMQGGGMQVGGGYNGVGNFQESGGYGYEVIEKVKITMKVEIRERFRIASFEYPPLCDRIRGHMRDFGASLKKFFGKVGHFFKKVGHALDRAFHRFGAGIKKIARKGAHGVKVVTEDVFEGVTDAFNCFASALHVQFRKCKSDWERAVMWSKCEMVHFKHWYEYRKLVREGKRRIYTRYQHDMLIAMEKFELSMNADYRIREAQCAQTVDVYGRMDIVYMETVGYEGVKAPYGYD